MQGVPPSIPLSRHGAETRARLVNVNFSAINTHLNTVPSQGTAIQSIPSAKVLPPLG